MVTGLRVLLFSLICLPFAAGSALAASHTVAPGESLYSISRQYGVSLQSILDDNAIPNPDLIHPGQIIQIGERAQPSTRGEAVARIAESYLGSPYVWGGATPAGFDCAGFVYWVYREEGITLTRYIPGLYSSFPRVDEVTAGDIVFFSNTYKPGLSHLGIAVDEATFVHAAGQEYGVIKSFRSNSYYAAHYAGAVRVIE